MAIRAVRGLLGAARAAGASASTSITRGPDGSRARVARTWRSGGWAVTRATTLLIWTSSGASPRRSHCHTLSAHRDGASVTLDRGVTPERAAAILAAIGALGGA
jgi:hypothetical protein